MYKFLTLLSLILIYIFYLFSIREERGAREIVQTTQTIQTSSQEFYQSNDLETPSSNEIQQKIANRRFELERFHKLQKRFEKKIVQEKSRITNIYKIDRSEKYLQSEKPKQYRKFEQLQKLQKSLFWRERMADLERIRHE